MRNSGVRGYQNRIESATDVAEENVPLIQMENNVHEVHTIIDISEKMWTADFIGLYSQYAALGIIFGMGGVGMNFCVYVYGGTGNVCANSNNIMFLPWSFKIFYAVFTDSYRPWGLRRKPYMLVGWGGVLFVLLILMYHADDLRVDSWIGLNLLLQMFVVFADVPSDGYLVELSRLETPEKRGQILSTANMIRLVFTVIAAVIQTLLLNGPDTNAPGCTEGWLSCWKFGLSVQEYYGLLFFIILGLFLPIVRMKEVDGSHIPLRSVTEFTSEIWHTLQYATTFFLIIHVIGIHIFSHLPVQSKVLMMYYIIKMTTAQSGINAIASGLAGVAGIWLFKTYFINTNWRHTLYFSSTVMALLNFLWILVYYDIGGLMSAWFVMFVNLDQSFAYGLAKVVFSMAVIELAKPGQEATTYELLIGISNASWTLAGVFATQLMEPMDAIGCKKDVCSANEVDITDKREYFDSDGPQRFTQYTSLIVFINIIGTIIFVRFLPKNKEQCHVWNKEGDDPTQKLVRGYLSISISVLVVLYGIVTAGLLLDSKTACLEAVGGSGCGG